MALLTDKETLISGFNEEMALRALEKIYYDPDSYTGGISDDLFVYNKGKVIYKGHLIVRDCIKNTIESLYIPGIDLIVVQNFDCTWCKNLKTLKGAPKNVVKDFNCEGCSSLKSLRGAPEYVGEDCWCSYIRGLTSLRGAPKRVGGDFSCSSTGIEDLTGLSSYIGGYMYCYKCENLKTLKGANSIIWKDLSCSCHGSINTDNDFISVNDIHFKREEN